MRREYNQTVVNKVIITEIKLIENTFIIWRFADLIYFWVRPFIFCQYWVTGAAVHLKMPRADV